jgi:small-conductance mechanosensitive channel
MPPLPSNISDRFSIWVQSLDPNQVGAGIALVVVVIILGGPLARTVFWIATRILQFLRVPIPEVFVSALTDLVRTILISLALFYLIDALVLADQITAILQRVVLTIVVLHVFVGAFRVASRAMKEVVPFPADAGRVWLTTAVKVFFVLLASASILELWGINIAGAVAGLGVLGAGLAIGMQDFIQNLMAGLTNAGERRFRRGDWVEAGGIEGVIEHIDLRSTVVMGFDRVPRHVPNSFLSNAVLLNKSRIDHWRVYWTIQLVRSATDAQVNQVCELVMTHIRSCGDFITDGSRTCLVHPRGISESGIELMIYIFCKTNDWTIWLEAEARLLSAVRNSVEAAGTSIAYPTSTLNFSPLSQYGRCQKESG